MKLIVLLTVLAAVLATFIVLSWTPSSEGRPVSEPTRSAEPSIAAVRTAKCKRETRSLRRAVADRRAATWRHQDSVGLARTPTAHRSARAIGCAYLRWIRHLWAERADKAYHFVVSLRDPETAIRFVFGSRAREAIAVAACESGDRDGHLSPHVVRASNGQYQGMFQMGSSERAIYGHGPSPYEQALAAHRYFVASGSDWSPWQCRPYGLAW